VTLFVGTSVSFSLMCRASSPRERRSTCCCGHEALTAADGNPLGAEQDETGAHIRWSRASRDRAGRELLQSHRANIPERLRRSAWRPLVPYSGRTRHIYVVNPRVGSQCQVRNAKVYILIPRPRIPTIDVRAVPQITFYEMSLFPLHHI
jgi:hypothetical protein